MAYFKTIANEIGSINNGINLYLETLKTSEFGWFCSVPKGIPLGIISVRRDPLVIDTRGISFCVTNNKKGTSK